MMTTPKDGWDVPGRGTPVEAPVEMDDAEDRTNRVGSQPSMELPPLPMETAPGKQRLVPKMNTITRPPTGRPADELIGRNCGGYVVDALLGEGGMGKVYRATNPRVGKRAAVKVIHPEHAGTPQIVDRFLQEAKAAAQLDDPNIIDLLDANELDDGRSYLIMPFVEGISLEELCEQHGVLSVELTASILFQICSGLDAAHHNGIIHRDIKPQNILVGPRHQRSHFVRIVDFGIAKLLAPHLAGKFATIPMMGTPGFMAPEQSSGGRDIDARADVYAVAVVAYRMLTGRRPYMDDSLYGLIEKQVSDAPFPRPRELRPDIPIEWDEALMAALANKREKRLATVRELALRLASGLPDGEQILRALAPRLAPSPLSPTAATLNPFLDHDIARRTGRQPRQSNPDSRRVGFAPWQLALVTCLLVGVGILGGVALGRSPSPVAAPDASALSSLTPVVSPPAATPTETPAKSATEPDAGAVAAAAGDHSPAQSSSAVPAAPVPEVREKERAASAAPSPSASASAAQAPVAPRPADGRGRSAAAGSPKPSRSSTATDASRSSEPAFPVEKSETGSLSRDESARLAKLGIGLLIVNAKPWAQISINGKLEGYTPKRKQLPAGNYTIRMTKDARNVDVEVVISPGKVSTVERSLR